MDNTFDIFDMLAEYEMSETEQLFMGCLALYGVVEASEMVSMILDCEDIHTKKFIDEFIDEFSSSPLVQNMQEEIDKEIYFVSPLISDTKGVLEMRNELNSKAFREFTREEILSAGEDPCTPVFNSYSDEAQNVVDMMSELGYDEEEIWVELHYIWENSQFATSEEATEDLFGLVKDKQDIIEDFDYFRDCIDCIAQYANTLPKWLLCGYSANEKKQLKITIKVDVDREAAVEPEKVTLKYNCALCTTNNEKACSWMIFWKENNEQTSKRIIAS